MTNLSLRFKFLRYLWGIETRTNGIEKDVARSFYDTYEELKLAPDNFFRIQHSRFYDTYEELKQEKKRKENERRVKFLRYLWGIETQRLY